jgi:hypothetical protein
LIGVVGFWVLLLAFVLLALRLSRVLACLEGTLEELQYQIEEIGPRASAVLEQVEKTALEAERTSAQARMLVKGFTKSTGQTPLNNLLKAVPMVVSGFKAVKSMVSKRKGREE